MGTKLISYDLNKQGQKYDEVIEYIQSLGSWAKPLKSQWLVKSDLSNSEIVEGLMSHGADANDAILVIDVTGDSAAWGGKIPTDVSGWMKTGI